MANNNNLQIIESLVREVKTAIEGRGGSGSQDGKIISKLNQALSLLQGLDTWSGNIDTTLEGLGGDVDALEESVGTLENDVDTLEETVGGIQQSMYKGIPIVNPTVTSDAVTIQPNVWNVLTSAIADLTVTKGTDATDVVSEYMIKFVIDSNYDADDNQIAFSGWTNLTWAGGDVPTWAAGNTYEISIVDNIAVYTEIESAAS